MSETETYKSTGSSLFAWTRYGQTMLWAALIFAMDGVCFGGYAFAPWAIIVNILFRLPSNLYRWKFKGSRDSLVMAKRCVLLIVTSALTIAYCGLLQRVAIHRAKAVSQAVEGYKIKNGDYPQTLDALVPDYLDEVPTLKPVLSPPRFTYRYTSTVPMLMFGPGPWPRPTMYNFETGKWALYD